MRHPLKIRKQPHDISSPRHSFLRIQENPQDLLPNSPLQIVVMAGPRYPPNEPGADLPALHLSEQF